MKILIFLLAAASFLACDPYNFGYKYNPTFILNAALRAIHNQDDVSFREISGREAMCVYGNQAGMAYLHERVRITTDSVNLRHVTVREEPYSSARYTGAFWSYYNEQYLVDILEKRTNETVGRILMDCNFGSDVRNDRLIGVPKRRMPRKECRITKIIPVAFEPLPVSGRCEPLKVALDLRH
jgi:hypothetical protein